MNTRNNPEAIRSRFVAKMKGYFEPYHPGNEWCHGGYSSDQLAWISKAGTTRNARRGALASLFGIGAWVPKVRCPASDNAVGLAGLAVRRCFAGGERFMSELVERERGHDVFRRAQ